MAVNQYCTGCGGRCARALRKPAWAQEEVEVETSTGRSAETAPRHSRERVTRAPPASGSCAWHCVDSSSAQPTLIAGPCVLVYCARVRWSDKSPLFRAGGRGDKRRRVRQAAVAAAAALSAPKVRIKRHPLLGSGGSPLGRGVPGHKSESSDKIPLLSIYGATWPVSYPPTTLPSPGPLLPPLCLMPVRYGV